MEVKKTPKNAGSMPGWASGLLELEDEARAFADFAQNCSYRVIGQRGNLACNYRQSTPIECGPAFCSLFGKSGRGESGEDQHGGSP